ncbi:MAG: hypothetical protein SFV21_02695, partial [Rhodospirillaceae bacterium]|nr:hypothetical protein [Rhodospirillaceae bacterium]
AAQHTDLARRMGEAATRDPVARAALAGAVRRYDQLYAALAADKPARDLLDEGPLGLAYRLFKEADQAAAAPGAPDDDELRRRLTDLAQRLDGAAPK